MPYIDPDERYHLNYSAYLSADSVGELNFSLTTLINKYIDNAGGLSYDNINGVIGVLECIKLELYRRVAGPYEDKKKEENGDVYPPALLPKG